MKDKIIFLDIDYVVNGRKTKEKIGKICGVDPGKLKLLKNLVDYSHAKIILSSTWRIYWDESLAQDKVKYWSGGSPKRYGRYLNAKFAEQGLVISGKTDDIHWSLRPKEILKWIHDHDIHRFVILDDEDFEWNHYQLEDFWVDTAYQDGILKLAGITEQHIERAKQILDEKYYKG